MQSKSEIIADIITQCALVHDREINPSMIDYYTQFLVNYSPEEIVRAADAHNAHPDYGRFFPKPADFIRELDGPTPTVEEVVTGAMSPRTPLDVLARREVAKCMKCNFSSLKHHDISFAVKGAVMPNLQDWKNRAKKGDFSPEEVASMDKYRVKCDQPFHRGICKLPPPKLAIESPKPHVQEVLAKPDGQEIKSAKKDFKAIKNKFNKSFGTIQLNKIFGDES